MKKSMLSILREWSIIIMVVLIILDLYMLFQVSIARNETTFWKSKMTPSVREQLSLAEHSMELEDLSSDINQLQKSDEQAARLINGTRDYLLLFIMRGTTCDNCLNMEMNIFKEYRERLQDLRVSTVMVLYEVDKSRYSIFVDLFGINNIAILDKAMILGRRFDKYMNPIILLLNRDKRVIYANISDYRDEAKSKRFFEKVLALSR